MLLWVLWGREENNLTNMTAHISVKRLVTLNMWQRVLACYRTLTEIQFVFCDWSYKPVSSILFKTIKIFQKTQEYERWNFKSVLGRHEILTLDLAYVRNGILRSWPLEGAHSTYCPFVLPSLCDLLLSIQVVFVIFTNSWEYNTDLKFHLFTRHTQKTEFLNSTILSMF